MPELLPAVIVLSVVPWFGDGSTVKWLPLYAAAIPCVLLFFFSNRYDWRDAVAIAFVVWAAASLLWSPDRLAGIQDMQRIGTAAVLYLGFRRLEWTGWGVTLAVALCLLAIAFVSWLPWGGFRNENFVTMFLVLAIPLMLAWNSHIATIVAIIAVAYLFTNPSVLEFAVLGLIALVWAVKRLPPIMTVIVAAGMFTASITLMYSNHGPSVLDRIPPTVATVKMWLDGPIGRGAGSFEYLWNGYRQSARDLKFEYEPLPESNRYALDADSDILQILAEFGPIGAVLAASVLIGVTISGPAGWTLAVFMALALISNPLQLPGPLLLGILALARKSRI